MTESFKTFFLPNTGVRQRLLALRQLWHLDVIREGISVGFHTWEGAWEEGYARVHCMGRLYGDELDSQPSTLKLQPSTLNSQLSTLNPKP